uniref:Golgi to ER traffic protein 4 homolog isoform X2 n=1 Tax=Fragaria vesca subsp. vesca TaxID=101020 RepID=UPI0005CA36CD|nr:PREDICTED: Golgi to ER traffic protein 4 homolog isoform X2 [Fragaria vesca subsp. vesca]
MSKERAKRGTLPPAQEQIEKFEKVVEEGNYYGAQQLFKSITARYVAAQRYPEALDILESGACIQLKHGQVTCGAELASLFVETLVKGKFPYNDETLVRVRKIYKQFPKIPVPQQLGDLDDDMQRLSETLGTAKTCVEGCSSFLKAAIKWSAEFGAPRAGAPEIHVMLANYMYFESPEVDMVRVAQHFVRGNNPKEFASTLVHFMGKCYPGEDDVAIARAVLMMLRDAFPIFNMLRSNFKSSLDREPSFHELLDEIAEKFYGVRRRNPLQGMGMFGEIFKMMGGD